MIPYGVTPSQLAWHVLAAGTLVPAAPGRCRICGGELFGEALPFQPSDNWMDEHQCMAKDSDLACAACWWALKNRNLLSLTIKRARLISPSSGLVDYTDDRIAELFAAMRRGFEPPYLFFVRENPQGYKRHVILEAAVSWGNPGYVTLLTADDNFTLPLDLARLADAAEELAVRRAAEPRLRAPLEDPFWRVASLLARIVERNNTKEKGETGDVA